MIERAHPSLARPAFDLFLQMDRPGMVRLRPGNVRGAEERHDWPVEGSRKVTWPAIGRNQEIRTAYTRLGQAQRQGMIG
jgi:hypothetical protein